MERGRGEATYLFRFSSGGLLKLKPDAFVLQVFRFVHNLIGCEEQARVFKEEVSGTLILHPFVQDTVIFLQAIEQHQSQCSNCFY